MLKRATESSASHRNRGCNCKASDRLFLGSALPMQCARQSVLWLHTSHNGWTFADSGTFCVALTLKEQACMQQ
jgi:hypothetical protein